MKLGLLACVFLAFAPAVQAETINVLVQRPPAAVDVYALRSLSVGRVAGADGRTMATSLERVLADLRDIDGRPLFELFSDGAGEGQVTGYADALVDERRFNEKRRLCPGTFNPKAKCEDAQKVEVEVSCRSRTISLTASIRIVRNGDSRLLLSRDVPQRGEARWCHGDSVPPDSDSVVAELIRRSVADVTEDFEPFSQIMPIRIREDRKGLSKEVGARFKAAVLSTRGDGQEGCAAFAALLGEAPTHWPLLFNLALCSEARGNFDVAIDGYERIGDREARVAADRARATIIAQQQFELRR
jgi:hypothetical protein